MNALMHFSQSWWQWVSAASWQLAALVVLVALATLGGKRFSARVRYVLWVLVLVKAFLPPTMNTPLSIGTWGVHPVRQWGGALMLQEKQALSPPPAFVQPVGDSPGGSMDSVAATAVVPARTPSQVHPALSSPTDIPGRHLNSGMSRVEMFLLLYLVGGVCFLGFVGVRYAWLLCAVRRAQEVDEGPLRVRLEELALRLGRRTAPELLLSREVTSPFLVGFLRPRIVLPEGLDGELTTNEMGNVLLHELVHWKRRDVLVGWLQVLVQALFWFHPFVWYANARLRHEREAACDAAALESAEGPPRVYGESLLKVLLNARGRSAAVSGFLGIFERDTRLQDRLEAIMDTRRKNRGTGIAGWAFVAVFALVFLPMAGARGTDPSDVSKPKQPASPAKLQEKPAPLAAPETVGAFRADSAALREAASTVEPLKLEFDVIRRFVQEPMRLPEALEALRKARPKFDRFAECVRGTDVEPLVRDALERVAKLEQVLQRGDAGEAKTIVAELGEAGPRIGKKIAELQQKAQPGEPAKATNPVAPQGDSAAGSKGANWSARQATGEPDTATAGDLATAWATLQPDAGEEWLELDYAPPMIANMVRIHETFNPGAVTGVVLLGERGEIFDTVPMNDSTRQAPAFLEVPFKQTTRPVKSVRVMLDTAKVHGWNEIDAVELAGPGGRAWAVDARASSSYADRKPRSRPVGSIATFEELFALNSDIPVNLSWGPTDQPDMLHGKKVRFEVVEMSLDGAPLQVLHAVFDAQIISAPKARWEIACSILDADGNVIARATEKLENSGVIVGVVDISPVIVKILFGGASQMLLEKARKFRIEVSGEVEEVPTPWASVSPVSPEPVPPGATVLGYVGDKEQGRRSIAAGGHAVAFTRPVNVAWVEAIQICASRYGSPQPPDEDFHVYLMNNNKEVIADLKFPYAMIERSDMKWYTLRTPSVEVPGEFLVGLAFNPHQTKGIYLGFDKASGESHSSVGLPDSGYEPGKGGEEWMVRVHVTAQPTNARGTMRLADWKPPVKEEPFKDCVEAKHDDGNSGGMQSYGGRGPAIRFRPADFLPKDKAGAPLALKGIRVYGSRYGSGYDPAKTLIHVTVLDPQNRALGKAEVPYAKFSYRQQWVDLPFENPVNIANPGEELTIAVNPEAHQTKGIYFHYNKNPKESHSSAGTVENGFQPVADREWMIRAHFSQGGGK